jgi:hypothetical protein
MLNPHPGVAAPNFMLNSILSLALDSPLEHAYTCLRICETEDDVMRTTREGLVV